MFCETEFDLFATFLVFVVFNIFLFIKLLIDLPRAFLDPYEQVFFKAITYFRFFVDKINI